MKRALVFSLIFFLICPAALALNADAMDMDAMDEAMALTNVSLREAGNRGFLMWMDGEDRASSFVYFAVELPYDEVTTGRYAGETFATSSYVDREITLFFCMDIEPTAPWILVQSTSFSRDGIVPGVTMDGKEQDVPWDYYLQDGFVSIYLFPKEKDVTRWTSADELVFSFESENKTVYVTVTPEAYAPIYELYSALMGCIRYANQDANSYLNAARLPAFSVADIQETPAGGATTLYTGGIASCSLTVSAPRGDDFYFIVLAQPDEPYEALATVFMHPGETTKVRVPEGEYAVFYARGAQWYGDYALFGADMEYYAMEGTVSVKLGVPGSSDEMIAIPDEGIAIDPANFPF